ncbi:MAG: NAD(P)H-binding protein [Myxococcota bacterium]|nr:NAD(P)H-binding protein [Myxococcota bacterium]MEC8422216.1 NAD(P)H-binding protein [Myxococcota bacterium]
MPRDRPVLLAGATGAVGRALVPVLQASGWRVRGASRDPERARAGATALDWVRLDVDIPATMAPALDGCGAAFFLVHGMSDGPGFVERERAAAEAFAAAAADAGLARIVYLGGMVPEGVPSDHLRSRLETGRILREGAVPCVELRAGMVVGPGSVSWQIVRDIAVRLPVQILPAWLESRSQPVALADVCQVLVTALGLPLEGDAVALDVPGPETLRAGEILQRVGDVLGRRPVQLRVPLMSPGLSAHWLRLVTRADPRVSAALVHGLAHDLVAADDGIWSLLPGHRRTAFDDAVRDALEAEERTVSARARRMERLIHRAAKLAGR